MPAALSYCNVKSNKLWLSDRWRVKLCHYYCLPVKRVSKAGPFLSLPLTCHHILQHWWWRYFTLLAENSLLAEHTMQTNLHALKKILVFWTASQQCVPQLRGFDALVRFLQSVWLFYTPLGHTRSFVKHSLAGLLLCLPHLSWKLLLPLVTVEGNSLHLVLSVLFYEGLDTHRYGELGCCISFSDGS